MMMRRFTFLSLLFVGLTALFAGCGEKDSSTGGTPTLQLHPQRVEVPAEGGHFTVTYQLENLSATGDMKILPEYEWVKNFDTSVAGEISFEVNPSYEAKPRTCRVEVIYPGVYPNPTFMIEQSEGLEASFTFQIKNVHANSIQMDVLPKDKTQPYIFLLGPKAYMVEENLLENDAAQIASDMEVIAQFGEAFGGTIQDVIGAFIYTGDQLDYHWNGVDRNTEYVAYAYGFDVATMQPTTEVCRVMITTPDIELYVVHFDFDVAVDGPNVSIDITPQGYDGPFFWDVLYAYDCPPGTSEDRVRSICEGVWEGYKGVYSSFFETPEQGFHFILNELAYYDTAHWEAELTANDDFVVFAFAMNEEGLLNSTPELKYFSTGDAKHSDNQFSITISEIKAREATVTVETTNNDPYTVVIATREHFAGMSDEEIMTDVCGWSSLQVVQGEFTTQATDLKPATDYQILTFGINGGRPSTALTRQEFTTAEAVVSMAKFSMEVNEFYDLSEIAQLNPAWKSYLDYDLVCPVHIQKDAQAKALYFSVMDAENYYFYSRESIVDALLQEGPSEDTDSFFLLDYGISFVFFGFVEDQEGNFTELWESEPIVFRYEDRGDAQEFLDWVDSITTRAKPAPRGLHTLAEGPTARNNSSCLTVVQ